MLVSVILQDRVQTGLSWTHMLSLDVLSLAGFCPFLLYIYSNKTTQQWPACSLRAQPRRARVPSWVAWETARGCSPGSLMSKMPATSSFQEAVRTAAVPLPAITVRTVGLEQSGEGPSDLSPAS